MSPENAGRATEQSIIGTKQEKILKEKAFLFHIRDMNVPELSTAIAKHLTIRTPTQHLAELAVLHRQPEFEQEVMRGHNTQQLPMPPGEEAWRLIIKHTPSVAHLAFPYKNFSL